MEWTRQAGPLTVPYDVSNDERVKLYYAQVFQSLHEYRD